MPELRRARTNGSGNRGYGRVEPGKCVDANAVRGNPPDDITRMQQVGFVMKGGVICKQDDSEVEQLAHALAAPSTAQDGDLQRH